MNLETTLQHIDEESKHMALNIFHEIQYKTEYIMLDNEIWSTRLQAATLYPNELNYTTHRYGCH